MWVPNIITGETVEPTLERDLERYGDFNSVGSQACLVETKGDGVTLSHCDQAGAKGWGVTKGRLCRNGDCLRSGKCLARSAFDASAVLFPCSSNIYEHLTLTLDSDGSDTLAQALKEAAERERQEELDEQLRQKQLGARRSFAR